MVKCEVNGRKDLLSIIFIRITCFRNNMSTYARFQKTTKTGFCEILQHRGEIYQCCAGVLSNLHNGSEFMRIDKR